MCLTMGSTEFSFMHNIFYVIQNGSTALIMASQNGHTTIVHRLLEAKANANYQSTNVRLLK